TPEMLSRALQARPDMVTLVPERRQEITTEGGLDVSSQKEALRRIVTELKAAEMPVSLFVDPDLDQVTASARIGASAVELHTGRFCDARTEAERSTERERLVLAAKMAVKHKLRCFAGHGIHYDNVADIASITEIEELNIGHSIVARAVLVGMERAVREMRDLAWQARRDALAAR
ncbi:MAG: pyridoxine 5'-phosphate synthase, partial [Myxococcota bacterium]